MSSAFDVILTDASGVPMPRPQRHEYAPGDAGTSAFLIAFHEWKDRVTLEANRAFDAVLRKELGR